MSKIDTITIVSGTNNVSVWKLVPKKNKPKIEKVKEVYSVPKEWKYI